MVEIDRKIKSIEESINGLTGEIDENGDQLLKISLDSSDIMDVVRSWTGIPVSKMKEDEARNLLNLETLLGEML